MVNNSTHSWFEFNNRGTGQPLRTEVLHVNNNRPVDDAYGPTERQINVGAEKLANVRLLATLDPIRRNFDSEHLRGQVAEFAAQHIEGCAIPVVDAGRACVVGVEVRSGWRTIGG